MNSKYNEIISTYLNQEYTDFAIQIDGPWGCGKTFYVDNELQKVILSKNKKVIILSVNGLSRLEDMNLKILYSYLKKEKLSKHKKIGNVTNSVTDLLLELAPSFETLNSITKISGILSKFTNTKIDFSPYVLIFDDLERISDNISISDFFGFIFDNFTSKGVKTVFISNETEIKDENYLKRKEKIIRRTISYTPNFEKQLELFFYTRYKEKADVFRQYKDFFISRLKKKDVRNLRTVAFVFDNFFEVIESIHDKDLLDKSFEMLFINILLLTDEYKKGNITINDLKDYKQLNDLNLAYFNAAKKETQTYASMFYSIYNHASGLEYKFVKSLFDFIVTGYLAKNVLSQELTQIYKPYSAPEQAYRDIQYLQDLEQDKLIELKNKIISFMDDGKYHITLLPKIYTTFKIIKEKNYIENFEDNFEKIFSNAFDKCSGYDENVSEYDALYFDAMLMDSDGNNDLIYGELINKIKIKTIEKQGNMAISRIESLFKQINSNDLYVKDYPYGELFVDIAKYNCIDMFFTLKNYGIAFFQSYLKQTFINVANPWKVYSKSKDSLVLIRDYIKKNLDKKAENHMRKQRFKELLVNIDEAINCLSESKEGI